MTAAAVAAPLALKAVSVDPDRPAPLAPVQGSTVPVDDSSDPQQIELPGIVGSERDGRGNIGPAPAEPESDQPVGSIGSPTTTTAPPVTVTTTTGSTTTTIPATVTSETTTSTTTDPSTSSTDSTTSTTEPPSTVTTDSTVVTTAAVPPTSTP